MTAFTQPLAAAAVSFAAALALVPVAGRLAAKWGMVAKPRADRWSEKPTPLLGGLAVYGGLLAAAALFLPWGRMWVIAGAAGGMFLLGLVDDRRRLSPPAKLVGQIVGACVLSFFGVGFQARPMASLALAASIVWTVAVVNAVNLMDNMDGLSGGVSAIAAFFLAVLFASAGRSAEATLAAALVGGLAGFLVFNFPPAKIFMGDAGALSTGIVLAGLTLSSSLMAGRKLGAASVVLFPALVMAVPLLDVTLVSVTRALRGRAVSEGGKDHTSHRLVRLGLSVRRTVSILYGLSAVCGLTALALAGRLGPMATFTAVAVLWISLGLFFVYLARPSMADPARPAEMPGRMSLVLGLAFKRRILEAAMDIGLALACFAGAYLLRFDFRLSSFYRIQIVASLPWVVGATLLAFQQCGLYRRVWTHQGFRDVGRFGAAAACAAVASLVLTVLLTRFEGYPRSVFPLYGLLLFLGISLTRASFRLLDLFLAANDEGKSPALVYGTGRRAEAAYRDLASPGGTWRPVGFLSPDPSHRGLRLYGLPVFGADEDWSELERKAPFHAVLIAHDELDPETLRRLAERGRAAEKKVLRFRTAFEELGGN